MIPKTSTLPKLADAARFDVIVVGAGASGIPAAIAAARQGARVALLEEHLEPGGAPVDEYITLLCGGPRVGLFLEMANQLNARHNITGQPVVPFEQGGCANHGRDYWYLPTAYRQVLGAMIAAEPNITLVGGARVEDVLVDESGPRRRIFGVLAEGPLGSRRTFAAPVTIDATGAGELAALAGFETRYGRDARRDFDEPYGPDEADSAVQPCTWMFISQRLRPGARMPGKLLGGFVESNYTWVGNAADPDFIARQAGAYLHWGVTVRCDDTRDPAAVARAQRAAFVKFEPELAVFQERGFAIHLAPRIGIRESRRVLGETVVTAADLLAGRFPDDTVAVCDFFLDAWGEHDKLPRTNVRAGIPYRALIPRAAEGLLVAGKAISGTHLAMSAYRVQPSMASVGTAAGIAAAMAATHKTDVRSIDVDALRARLRAMGVID